MKTVSILVPESSVMQAIADPQYLFSAVNQFLAVSGKTPLFNVQLVGAEKEIKLNGGIFSVHTDLQIQDVEQTDLILIPALFGDMTTAIAKNQTLIPWIQAQYEKGAEVASLCVGAFLLASTGLLDGKKCSTHWGFQNEFREMFPKVEVIDGSIITEEHRIWLKNIPIEKQQYWLQNILRLTLTEKVKPLLPCFKVKKIIRTKP
jgi:transcriptional regulator GlxA family with amidase domain